MYEKVYDMLNCEIAKIEAQGELNSGSLENLYKLVDVIKDLQTIEAMGEYGQSGDSRMYNPSYGRSYNGGMSGRYYRGGNRGSYGYSYGDNRGEMINHLEQAMNQASNDSERMEIRKMIDRMR